MCYSLSLLSSTLIQSRDCKDCRNDKSSNISIDMIDDNPYHLKGTFFGPEETPYEGGRYEVVCILLFGLLVHS